MRAYTNLSSTAISEKRYERSEAYLEKGIAYATERDLDSWRLYMLGTLAVGALEQGRWDEAADISAEVVRSASAAAIHRAPSLVVLGLVRARRGDPEIWPVLDEALALVERIGELQRLAPAAAARSEAALLEGRPGPVERETQAVYRLALERGSGWEIGELAWLRRQAGIDEAVPEGAAEPWAYMLADDWSRAAETWTELGCPYEAALALGQSEEDEDLRRALAEPARARRQRGQTRAPRLHAQEPCGAHRARARGRRARLGGDDQLRDRRPPLPLGEDGGTPRLGHPAQARRAHQGRGERRGGPPGDRFPRSVAALSNLGNSPDVGASARLVR